jgi:uncharacterized protein (TIGR00369 family)
MSRQSTPSDAEIIDLLNAGRPACVRTLGGRVIEGDRSARSLTMDFEVDETVCHSSPPVVQGGFIAGMVDTTMAHTMLFLTRLTASVPTLELKVSYLRPVRPGALRSSAQVLHLGRSVAFLEAHLSDLEGELLAKASSTIRIRRGT